MIAARDAADAFRKILPEPATVFCAKDGTEPRFEAFSAGISICSQKVRTVLFEKGRPFLCHEMNPAPDRPPANWMPEYIRMRMIAVRENGMQLVSGFSGNSSVATEGVDPCAIPTLIDHEENKVVIDSKLICDYVDATDQAGSTLKPANLASDIERHIGLCDTTPHPAILYGGNSPLDRRPETLKNFSGPPMELKLKLLGGQLEAHRDEPDLVAAYEAKIKKEQAQVKLVGKAEDLERVYADVDEIFGVLEADLAQSQGKWLFGDAITMADLFWGINLHRLQNVGVRTSFGDRTKAYADRLYRHKSLTAGLIAWPAAWFAAPEYFDDEINALHRMAA